MAEIIPSLMVEPARAAAIKGAHKLLELLRPNGKFIYQYDYPNHADRSKKYNLLRHCGALWSMMTTARQIMSVEESNKFLPAISTSLQWLNLNHIEILPTADNSARPPKFVLWHNFAKLGANALAVLALSEYIRWIIGNRFNLFNSFQLSQQDELLTLTDDLANGIYWFLADGKIRHKVEFPKLQENEFQSDYYTGEALFALIHWWGTGSLLAGENISLSSHNKIIETLDVLHKLAAENYGLHFQSHWMLYAVSHAMQTGFLYGPSLAPYLNNLVEAIITDGNYRRRKQANPIACRSEGLLAAWQMASALSEEHRIKLRQELDVNIMLQLQYAMPDGAIVEGDKSRMVRIDNIQHNISAFTNYVLMQNDPLDEYC